MNRWNKEISKSVLSVVFMIGWLFIFLGITWLYYLASEGYIHCDIIITGSSGFNAGLMFIFGGLFVLDLMATYETIKAEEINIPYFRKMKANKIRVKYR